MPNLKVITPHADAEAAPLSILEQLRQRKTLLSSSELIAILGITRDTLCDWVRAGRIEAYKLSDGYKFEPLVVVRWLEDRRTP